MPELPEVETVANGVNERIRGERIESVWFSGKSPTFKTPAAEMAAKLSHKRIETVRRVGKHIVFDFTPDPGKKKQPNNLQWIVHLGMTGQLLVCTPGIPTPPHTHAVLELSSGRE